MLKYKDSVKFIYRDFPLDDVYPDSSSLGMAGRCADEQGKFWAFHDKMFGSDIKNSYAAAIQIGADGERLLGCVRQQKYLSSLEKDLLDGLNSGVRGTPTFFFIKKGAENEPLRVEGAIPQNVLEELISKLLEV